MIPFGGGSGPAVGTSPARASVPAGSVVALEHAGAGRSATHLLTGSPPGQAPAVFTRVTGGAVPNAAVWGFCLGGTATRSTAACPVPPVEGPRTWDGESYLSLGAALPGDVRELRLSPALAGRQLRLWCSLHPSLEVTLDDGGGPSVPAVPVPRPPAVAAPPPGEVRVAPTGPAVELLTFSPAEVRVPVGSAVTWRVSGPSPHTVEFGPEPELLDGSPADASPSAPPGGWDGTGVVRSGFLSTDPGAPGGPAFSLTFRQPGRFPYACRFHPTMRGTVVVS